MNEEIAYALVAGAELPDGIEEDRFDPLVDWEDDGHFKHDITNCFSVVRDTITGDLWRFDYQYSDGDGLLDDSITFHPVEEVTKTVTAYVVKKG
jgi:hypothetical protein